MPVVGGLTALVRATVPSRLTPCGRRLPSLSRGTRVVSVEAKAVRINPRRDGDPPEARACRAAS